MIQAIDTRNLHFKKKEDKETESEKIHIVGARVEPQTLSVGSR